jgi:hypothetical protein
MNQKQLANVLIKILGLSLCAHSVAAVIVAIIGGLQIGMGNNYMPDARSFLVYFTSLIFSLIPFAIGIFLIIRSRWLTEKLFKDE